MTTICFIEDTKPGIGGSSLTNDDMMKEGLTRDYEILVYQYGNNELLAKKKFIPPKADYYFITNYHFINPEVLKTFLTENKFFRYTHDIPPFIYTYRSFLNLHNEQVAQLMLDNALHTFFNSPLQQNLYSQRLNVNFEKSSIIPPSMNLNLFQDLKLERIPNSYLYVGDISYARGIDVSIETAIADNADLFVIIGPESGEPGYLEHLQRKYGKVINIEYLGEMSNDKINFYLNQYENFTYFPRIYDSFCRKVAEAEKSGINMMVDKPAIGYYYFPDDYDYSNECLRSVINIWNKIDEIIRCDEQ